MSSQYEVKMVFQGTVSHVKVEARDSNQAKQLVREQYGSKVNVLEARPAKQ
jgi:hypothetical protein